jgi:hypothetical protein
LTPHCLLFSARIYPRAAIEGAIDAFRGVCDVRAEDDPCGTRATFELPEGASEDVLGEFCNIALATAVEMHIGSFR